MFKVESVGAYPKALHPHNGLRFFARALRIVDGRFDQRGIATLVTETDPIFIRERPREVEHKMWGANILRFNPETERLKLVEDGFIQVYRAEDPDMNPLLTIDPRNTRAIIKKATGRVVVRERGFVLPPPPYDGLYQSPINYSLITAEELLKLVSRAESGEVIKGEDWLHDKLVIPRVSLPMGTEVELITLNGWSEIYSDQVVIDPVSRKLVEREMVYPFAKDA